MPVSELIRSAIDARKKAYAPYSNYMVGAAVLTNELRIYTGCNIENAAYTPSICAERTAVSKAVSEGRRGFKAIAVVGSPKGEVISQYAFPCGVCRQVLREFSDPDSFFVIVAKSETDYKIYHLKELLPESFGPENLY
ncbi:cytidine deaminase [bacterium 1xD42-62]|uniref:Cytidine deaminase n=1 Tax=Parablautia muri TaxID=2320879 RepID=A0A9X5GTK0_9FIRM|nr:cytidine deaminase [Parablautia muri]